MKTQLTKRERRELNVLAKEERKVQLKREQEHKQRVVKWQVVGFAFLLLTTFGAWSLDARQREVQKADALRSMAALTEQKPEQEMTAEEQKELRLAMLESEAETERLIQAAVHIDDIAPNVESNRLVEVPQGQTIAQLSNANFQQIAADTVGNTPNPFLYNGQYQDATGLYYLRNRYYNPATGRFLTHDPMMGSPDDPASLHRYLYASADPVNNIDPNGLESLSSISAAMGAGNSIRSVTSEAYLNVFDTSKDTLTRGPEIAGHNLQQNLAIAAILSAAPAAFDAAGDIVGGVRSRLKADKLNRARSGLNRIVTTSGFPVPFGFANQDEYIDFVRDLRGGLPNGTEPLFMGSSITGSNHLTGAVFDVGRRSDYDIALVNPSLFDQAQAAGLRVKDGIRIGPLSADAFSKFSKDSGLDVLSDNLGAKANRKVDFMIYKQDPTGTGRNFMRTPGYYGTPTE